MVIFPSNLINDIYTGSLLGYKHESTSIYNILGTDEFPDNNKFDNLEEIGVIINKSKDGLYYKAITSIDSNDKICIQKELCEKPKVKFGQILAIRTKETIEFQNRDGVNIESKQYSIVNDVFSRNTGILESDYMLKSTAVICGCGSVGSLVAMELARAGVGNFILSDNDIIEYHNIGRHQCGIQDVGRYKVDALADKIFSINPIVNIGKNYDIIERAPKELFDKYCSTNNIFIGCADNREGDLYANRIAKLYQASFVSIGLWERATIGEIFYTIYEDGVCYNCFRDLIGNDSQRQESNNRFYTTEEDLRKVNFEPGLSIDINFVTLIGIKISIDLLNLDNENYNLKALNTLSQYSLVCNKLDDETQKTGFTKALEVISYNLPYLNECENTNCCKLIK